MCKAVAKVVSAVAGLFTGGKTPKMPEVQAPVAPVAPPQSQAAQAPDQQAVRNTQANTTAARPSTMLTGMDGVDPAALNLGKSVLLGQ